MRLLSRCLVKDMDRNMKRFQGIEDVFCMQSPCSDNTVLHVWVMAAACESWQQNEHWSCFWQTLHAFDECSHRQGQPSLWIVVGVWRWSSVILIDRCVWMFGMPQAWKRLYVLQNLNGNTEVPSYTALYASWQRTSCAAILKKLPHDCNF